MNLIFKCIAGSRMFGVHNEHSDFDFKGVYLLPKEQRNKPPKEASINTNTYEGGEEYFHFEAFLNLVKEGQTIPFEMLFCQPENVVQSSPLWDLMVANRKKLVHKNITSFFGFAREQAMKYSEKGNRIQAFLGVKSFLLSKDPKTRLRDYRSEVESLVATAPYVSYKGHKLVSMYDRAHHLVNETFLEVCEVKLGFNHKIEEQIKIIDRKLSVYGKRSLDAFKNDAVDYKALSHCIRVAVEAKELLKDHIISLPLKKEDRDLVLSIKEGKMPKDQILALVDKSLNELSSKEIESTLPEKADEEFIDMLLKQYKEGVF